MVGEGRAGRKRRRRRGPRGPGPGGALGRTAPHRTSPRPWCLTTRPAGPGRSRVGGGAGRSRGVRCRCQRSGAARTSGSAAAGEHGAGWGGRLRRLVLPGLALGDRREGPGRAPQGWWAALVSYRQRPAAGPGPGAPRPALRGGAASLPLLFARPWGWRHRPVNL